MIRAWVIPLLLLPSVQALAEDALVFRASTARDVLDELRRVHPLVRARVPRILADTTPPPGLEADAPAELRLIQSGVILVGLHVADREAVDEWLSSQLEEPEAGIHLVWAHAPEALCARREAHLWCQIGVGEEGVRPLRKATEAEPSPPPEGRWALRAHASRLTRWLLRWELARAQRAMHFESPEGRRARRRAAARRAQARGELLRDVQDILLIRDEGELRLELNLSPSAAGRLDEATVPIDPRIAGWTMGPALLSGFSRLGSSLVAGWTKPLGLGDGPSIRIDGGYALAAFGVDPYHRPEAELGVAHRMGAMLSSALAAPSASSSTTTVHLKRDVAGTPLELLDRDGVMVMGYGHGAGAAAVRRLENCSPLIVPDELLVHARIDLHAIKAALNAIPEPAMARPELGWLQSVQAMAQAWPRELRSLELELRRAETQRIQLSLQAVP
ncbi:MAG: hypothetical protein AAGD10_00655 [Myxococcota bacterium]